MFTCTATAPSFVADILDKDPRNEPMGVRTALTITTSFNLTLELYKRLLIKFILKKKQLFLTYFLHDFN